MAQTKENAVKSQGFSYLVPHEDGEFTETYIKEEVPSTTLYSQDSLDVYDIKIEENANMEMLEAPQTAGDTEYASNDCEDTVTYLVNEDKYPQDSQHEDNTNKNGCSKYTRKTAKCKKNLTKYELMELNGTNKVLFSESFFKIVEKNNTTPHQVKMCGLIAACQTCGKKIKGSLGVSSNFIRHLKVEHPPKFVDFQALKEESRQSSARRCHFTRDILDFICKSKSPLSIIKSKSFQKLCPGKNFPSRRSVTRLLEESHSKYIEGVITELDKVEYVCVTADVWSGGEKSFFGYTCHWLDAHNLDRRSVALACRRFKGTQSIEQVTETICDINKQYKLPTEKIVYTITDNGSNFINAFKELGIELMYDSDDGSNFGSDHSGSDSDDFSSESEDLADIAALKFESVSSKLSPHFPCPSYALNLLATSDFNNIIKSSEQEIQDIHRRSFNG